MKIDLAAWGRSLFQTIQSIQQNALKFVLVAGCGAGLFLGLAPAQAMADTNPSQDAIDRAYDVRVSSGQYEEAYQQRLQDGQDPEKMSRAFERVPSFADKTKEVPETSALEKIVSKTREAVDSVTSNKAGK
jgi:hypothetical protein